MQEEREKLRKIKAKKNQNLKIWKTLSLFILQNMRRTCSEENTKGVAETLTLC